MEEEPSFKVETFFEATSRMIKLMGRQNILEKMNKNIGDHGRKIKNTDMEFINGVMVLAMRETIKTVRDKVKAL